MESKKVIEALLLVTKEPLSLDRLENVTGFDRDMIMADLHELEADFISRGIKVYKISGGWQLGTDPETSLYVERLLNTPVETVLSQPALETLAIVAYRQPITRQLIEQIRGVNSDSPIDTLIGKRLVREVGRDEGVGRPFLYGTTEDFLKHFGLGSLEDLPRDQIDSLRLPPEVILTSPEPELQQAVKMEQTVDQSSLSSPSL